MFIRPFFQELFFRVCPLLGVFQKNKKMKDYIYIEDAASYLDCSVITIRRLVANKRISYGKAANNRLIFREKDLDSFVQKRMKKEVSK